MTIRKFVDWEKIRSDYVYGWYDSERGYEFPIFKQLCERYGVDIGAITNRSYREKWGLHRAQFREKIVNKRRHELGQMKWRESSRYDTENIVRMEQLGMFLDKYMEHHANSDEPPDMRDIERATKVLDQLHKIGRNIFGEPQGYDRTYEQMIQEVEQEIERKKDNSREGIEDIIKKIKKRTRNESKSEREDYESKNTTSYEVVADENGDIEVKAMKTIEVVSEGDEQSEHK
jgi:hypothetical protein